MGKPIDDLNRAATTAVMLRNDTLGIASRRKQKCSHRRRRFGRKLGHQRVPKSRPGTAEHRGHQAQGGAAVLDGQRCLVVARETTNLDPWSFRRQHIRRISDRRPNPSQPEPAESRLHLSLPGASIPRSPSSPGVILACRYRLTKEDIWALQFPRRFIRKSRSSSTNHEKC